MDNMVFAAWVSKRLEFSNDDKNACFDTVKLIVDIASEVRRNGLLSIDEKIPAYDDELLRFGLQLSVDSTETETLRDTMQTRIIFGNYRGAELLKRLLILHGVLAIQSGDNPTVIELTLRSYFGEEFLKEFNK